MSWKLIKGHTKTILLYGGEVDENKIITGECVNLEKVPVAESLYSYGSSTFGLINHADSSLGVDLRLVFLHTFD